MVEHLYSLGGTCTLHGWNICNLLVDERDDLVPMQCTGNVGCFPRGKRAVIVCCYTGFLFYSCVQCFRLSGWETNFFLVLWTGFEPLVFGSRINALPIQPPCLYINGKPQWGTADAEIKNPPGGSQGLSKVPSF